MQKMFWLFGGIALYLIITVVYGIWGEGRDLQQQDHMHSSSEQYLHKDLAEERAQDDIIEDSAPAVSVFSNLANALKGDKKEPASNSVVNTPSGGGSGNGVLNGTTGWYLPLNGQVTITGAYGLRSYFHSGIDLDVMTGENNPDVHAVADGTVSKVAYMAQSGNGSSKPSGYGNYIQLSHDVNGTTHYSLYAHLKNLPKLKVGDTVKEGDVIGIEGNTGCGKCGTHTHLEIGYMDDEKRTKYTQINGSQFTKSAKGNAWWWANSANWVRSDPRKYFTELDGKQQGAVFTRAAKAPSNSTKPDGPSHTQ